MPWIPTLRSKAIAATEHYRRYSYLLYRFHQLLRANWSSYFYDMAQTLGVNYSIV